MTANQLNPGNFLISGVKWVLYFQDFKLLKDRNIYENLSFVLAVTGTTGREIKKKSEQCFI